MVSLSHIDVSVCLPSLLNEKKINLKKKVGWREEGGCHNCI